LCGTKRGRQQQTSLYIHALLPIDTHTHTKKKGWSLYEVATKRMRRILTTIEAQKRNSQHCNTLQHTATHCNTLQHTATHCNTLQCTAMHCTALQCICNTLHYIATHCNTLQHTATHCNTLQHTLVCVHPFLSPTHSSLDTNTLPPIDTHTHTHNPIHTHTHTHTHILIPVHTNTHTNTHNSFWRLKKKLQRIQLHTLKYQICRCA